MRHARTVLNLRVGCKPRRQSRSAHARCPFLLGYGQLRAQLRGGVYRRATARTPTHIGIRPPTARDHFARSQLSKRCRQRLPRLYDLYEIIRQVLRGRRSH